MHSKNEKERFEPSSSLPKGGEAKNGLSPEEKEVLANSDTILETAFAVGSNSIGEGASQPAEGVAKKEASDFADSIGASGTIGRLVLGETLGTGAFGLVVSAFDPQLKRKLAVKILKPEVFDSSGGEDAQKRLMREARAMAKISHPNVVTVHDIGTVNGQIYVAMEFVEGSNLQHWLDSEERDRQSIVDKFVLAGRGLAAAHREGLVHRDFKPDNVLVGKRGEVCVADFGLVSIGKRGEPKSSEFVVGHVASEEMDLTQVGMLMGTALFMAPEQHQGKEVTAASDQFSFCASLYRALAGHQPFAGTTYKRLRSNVLRGKLDPFPKGKGVPRWVQKHLVKGLSTRAEDRHASMAALLAHLLDDPVKRRRKRLRFFAGPLLGIAVAGGLYWGQQEKADRCGDIDSYLDGIWDTATKEHLARVFKKAGRESAFTIYSGAMTRHSNVWVSHRRQVCETAGSTSSFNVREFESDMACLDQRLQYLKQLNTKLLTTTEGLVLDGGLKAIVTLGPLSACTARGEGANLVALPTGRRAREEIKTLGTAVDNARALFDLGEMKEAETLLLQAMEVAKVQYPPVLAKVNLLIGKTKSAQGELESAEAYLSKSVEQGTRSGDDFGVANAWLELQFIEGMLRENYKKSHEMARMAELSMVRGQANEGTLGMLKTARAQILTREGKTKEAIALLESILPLYIAQDPGPGLITTLTALGAALEQEGDFAKAVENYRLAQAHVESLFGKTHPENIYILNNLSVALKNSGDIRGAREALEQSLQLSESTYGESNQSVVYVLTNLVNIYRREGDLEKAQSTAERTIVLAKETLGAEHPQVTKLLTNLAIVLVMRKQLREATLLFLDVLARNQKQFPGDTPQVASALNNVGEALVAEEKFLEALGYLDKAKAMKESVYGEDHIKVSSTYAILGKVHHALHHREEAVGYYRRALRIYEKVAGTSHPRTLALMTELAALYEERGDANAALPLLEKAVAARAGAMEKTDDLNDRFALARVQWALGKKAVARKSIAELSDAAKENEIFSEVAVQLEAWRSSHE